jgi:hypothetical protein
MKRALELLQLDEGTAKVGLIGLPLRPDRRLSHAGSAHSFDGWRGCCRQISGSILYTRSRRCSCHRCTMVDLPVPGQQLVMAAGTKVTASPTRSAVIAPVWWRHVNRILAFRSCRRATIDTQRPARRSRLRSAASHPRTKAAGDAVAMTRPPHSRSVSALPRPSRISLGGARAWPSGATKSIGVYVTFRSPNLWSEPHSWAQSASTRYAADASCRRGAAMAFSRSSVQRLRERTENLVFEHLLMA